MEKKTLELKVIPRRFPWVVDLELTGDVSLDLKNKDRTTYAGAINSLHKMMEGYQDHRLTVNDASYPQPEDMKLQGSLEAYAEVHNKTI